MQDGVELIWKYFPDLTAHQKAQFEQLYPLYHYWNQHINVISRADMDNLYERHVLHSLAIAKACEFQAGTEVVDVGTGGGFPGIPLAILFPEVRFHLVDSIGKKIKVVKTVATDLGVQNVEAQQVRAEELTGTYDFYVSRAVAQAQDQVRWAESIIHQQSKNDLPNGMLLLKGGNLAEELRPINKVHYTIPISDFFLEPFFETKLVLYISI